MIITRTIAAFKVMALTLIACLTFSYPTSLQAANLHVIMAIDTDDTYIGDSVEQDMLHYQAFVRRISQYTQHALHEKIFEGPGFMSNDVYAYVQSLTIDHDDIVMFYYSGHGYRTIAKSAIWPAFYFGNHQYGIDMLDIINFIADKAPRMSIVMADTCNNMISDLEAPPWQHELQARRLSEKQLTQAFAKLFLDKNLLININSAEPGQYSYGFETGGIFTNSFLRSFDAELSRAEPNWQHLLQTAKDRNKFSNAIYEIIDVNAPEA